jgi:hypothetical protein
MCPIVPKIDLIPAYSRMSGEISEAATPRSEPGTPRKKFIVDAMGIKASEKDNILGWGVEHK